MEDVCEYIITKDSSFVAMLINYQTDAAPFPPSFFLDASTSVNPTTWWKAVEKCGVPHNFVELALQLLSAPAASASTERIFSSFGVSSLRYGIGLVMRKQPSWYFGTGSSEDFVIWIIDVSNG